MSNEVCPSRKMGVNIRYKNATKAGCDRKQEKKQSCEYYCDLVLSLCL